MERFKSQITNELNELKTSNNYRYFKNISQCEGKYIIKEGAKLLDFASNNYLGMRDHPEVKEASIKAIEKYGAGSGASRLISGECSLYYELESIIAHWKHKERAIIFNSGYDANLGVISTLFSQNDVIFTDKLNHASIYDGIKASGAELIRYRHNDIADLRLKLEKYRHQYRHALVITDTVFSMDGDLAYLGDIGALKFQYDFVLMTDEAHGTGVFGDEGSGVCESQKVLEIVDINMGTLGKSIGTSGAYIAADSYIIEYLYNKCRSLIFTTALPPSSVGGAIKSIEIIKSLKNERSELLKKSCYLREQLASLGFSTLDSKSQIVPVVCKSTDMAVALAEALKNNGIYAPAIRYPTVPHKLPRIRISVNTIHTYEDLAFLVKVIEKYK